MSEKCGHCGTAINPGFSKCFNCGAVKAYGFARGRPVSKGRYIGESVIGAGIGLAIMAASFNGTLGPFGSIGKWVGIAFIVLAAFNLTKIASGPKWWS